MVLIKRIRVNIEKALAYGEVRGNEEKGFRSYTTA